MSNAKAASDVKGGLGKTREELITEGFAKSKQIVAKKDELDDTVKRWSADSCEARRLQPKADSLRATASTLLEKEAVMLLDAEIRQKQKAFRDGIHREWEIKREISALEQEYEAVCNDVIRMGRPIDTKVDEKEDVKIKVEEIHDARAETLVKQENSKKRQVGGADEEAPMEKKVKVEVVEVKEEM